MNKHLQRFSRIFVDLASLGVVHEESDKVGLLLRSLPESISALSSISRAMKWYSNQLAKELKSNIDRRSQIIGI